MVVTSRFSSLSVSETGGLLEALLDASSRFKCSAMILDFQSPSSDSPLLADFMLRSMTLLSADEVFGWLL